MNCNRNSYAFAKVKYDHQIRNSKGIIDVKEQIWLTDVTFEAVSLNTS